MSLEVERDVIRQRLAAQWSTTSIAWDAMNGAPFARQAGVAFVRPRVEVGGGTWVSISGALRKRRVRSVLILEVYVPANTGNELAAQYCDALVSVFSAYSSGEVVFEDTPFAREVGQDAEHYKWMVFAPYYREEAA